MGVLGPVADILTVILDHKFPLPWLGTTQSGI